MWTVGAGCSHANASTPKFDGSFATCTFMGMGTTEVLTRTIIVSFMRIARLYL